MPGDLTVPSGKTCTIKPGVRIGNDVVVSSGATLIDQAAVVVHDVQANSPKGIGIGGSGSRRGSVGHDVQISGVSGAGPGTTTKGANYICDTNIGHDIQVQNSGGAAGPWIIGDRDEECTGGANQVGNDVQVQNNKNRIDVADNEQGTPPYAVGIGNDLQVFGNTVSSNSPVVESNFVGNTAQCQAGTKKDADGTPNIVGVSNQGCP